MSHEHVPGVLAVTLSGVGNPPDDLRHAVHRAGHPPLRRVGEAWMTSWGRRPRYPTEHRAMLLSGPARRGGALVTEGEVTQLLRDGKTAELGRLHPPFAALGLSGGALRVVVDSMGLQQIYFCQGSAWAAVCTSAGLLASMLDAGLDEQGVLVQSQVGWQLDTRTVFAGVRTPPPGASLFLARGRVRVIPPEPEAVRPGTVQLDEAVDSAATVLTEFLARYLDETPSSTLQLTGGMDSRLVLSAIPEHRRAEVRTMTLGVPGSSDAVVAQQIADRWSLQHHTQPLDGLATLGPREWFERVRRTASHHESMLNPIAKAVTTWAEEFVVQGDRLGGLGGEIARGFYYYGQVRPRPVTRRRSDQLALWRIIANESVEPWALHPRHRSQARPVALEKIHEALVQGGDEWFNATDALYYRHRMSRWAGLAETVASHHRDLVNPLLDPRFTSIARNLSPRDKSNAHFLGRLQMHLDPHLGLIPLDGRPAPSAYASPGVIGRAHQAALQARSAARKARQRLTRASRPPAGGHVVTAMVTEHLRQHPTLLDPVRDSGWLDPVWMSSMLDGAIDPSPSTCAFVMNLHAALGRLD